MAEFTGQNLYCAFICAAGTVVLSSDYRTLNISPTVGLADASAGNDLDKTYLATLKDGKYSWKGLAQTGGTVLRSALVEGTGGTLIIGEEGTAAGKPKETVPVISMGAQIMPQYDNVVEISCEFQKNGARVLATY